MLTVPAVHLYSSVLIVPLKCQFPILPSSTLSSATDEYCMGNLGVFYSPAGNIRTRCIVDKDGSCNSLDVEVVVIVPGDGEVPHSVDVVGGNRAVVGNRDCAVGGLDMLTFG
jgi:hypothetical protein